MEKTWQAAKQSRFYPTLKEEIWKMSQKEKIWNGHQKEDQVIKQNIPITCPAQSKSHLETKYINNVSTFFIYNFNEFALEFVKVITIFDIQFCSFDKFQTTSDVQTTTTF